MDNFLKNVCRILIKNHYDMYKSKCTPETDRNQYYGKSVKKLYLYRISFWLRKEQLNNFNVGWVSEWVSDLAKVNLPFNF